MQQQFLFLQCVVKSGQDQRGNPASTSRHSRSVAMCGVRVRVTLWTEHFSIEFLERKMLFPFIIRNDILLLVVQEQ